jgi:hypothetical protein
MPSIIKIDKKIFHYKRRFVEYQTVFQISLLEYIYLSLSLSLYIYIYIYIYNKLNKFSLLATSIEKKWQEALINYPYITRQLLLKLIYKLLLHHITDILQLIFRGSTHFMSPLNFRHHYKTPIKFIKIALQTLENSSAIPTANLNFQINAPYIIPKNNILLL